MIDEPSRRAPQQDSNYDGAWKEALRDHLSEFIAKYFPVEHAAIDWSYQPDWFDKELSQVLGEAGRRNQEVDVLVRVRLLTGGEQWILLHLEIQTSYEEAFSVRVARYNAGLHWVFQRRAATLVVLADLRRDWRPDEDLFQFGGFESRVKFPMCKLIGKLDSEWRNDNSLPVLLARAQIEALRTAGDPEERYRSKWLLVRGLYDLGYNPQEVREVIRLVDWMMHLRVDLEQRFRQELNIFEEQQNMPYITSMERLAEARGKADTLVVQLTKLCGSLPEAHEGRIRDLSIEQLQKLGEDLLDFHSLADLERWLEQYANSAT
jgi:hypothetical protein